MLKQSRLLLAWLQRKSIRQRLLASMGPATKLLLPTVPDTL